MSDMKSGVRNIRMPPYEELFGMIASAGTEGENVKEIVLTEIFSFHNHPCETGTIISFGAAGI